MKIAREGVPFIVIGLGILAAILAVSLTAGGWWWLVVVLWAPIAVWVPFFFRDPDRPGDRGPDVAVAPADGRVVSIDEIDEPSFVHGRVRRVAIFMNVFNVHVNRYPTDGTVAHREYRKGRFLNATLDKASDLNERMTLGIDSPRGPIVIHQIAGLIARRIVTDHHPGTPVHQGERLGIIRFGSRVELLLPPDVTLLVSVGDQVRSGQTVIGKWTS